MRRLLTACALVASVVGLLPNVAGAEPSQGGTASTAITYFKLWEFIGATQLVGSLPLPDETAANITIEEYHAQVWVLDEPPIYTAIPDEQVTGQTVDGRSITGSCAGPGGSAESPQGGFSQPDANHVYMTLLCTGQIDGGPVSAFTVRTSQYLRSRLPGTMVNPGGSDGAQALGTYDTQC